MAELRLDTGENPGHFEIRVSGRVQGVGFRPLVWRVANQNGLQGVVYNSGASVVIRCVDAEPNVCQFVEALRDLARQPIQIVDVEVRSVSTKKTYPDFQIVSNPDASLDTASDSATISIGLDTAMCPVCQQELCDPDNRRYRYPFISCAQCGPRFSILQKLPFDRANTTMASFALCDECSSEYHDPNDRRFHAQTTSCAKCGPGLQFLDSAQRHCKGDPIALAQSALKQGKILALKGVGGFQLVVDASNDYAVKRLRERKHRPHKPLALMVRSAEVANRYVDLDDVSCQHLESSHAPIVLLGRREDGDCLSSEISPGLNRLGVMLPSSPLHYLLIQAFDAPLVVTSGNVSGAPQSICNESALQELADVADFFLLHNRDIVNRLDDSVLQPIGDSLQPIRLGRGYTPHSITLPDEIGPAATILAMGADLKNSIGLLAKSECTLLPYLGDLEDVRALQACESQRDYVLSLQHQVPQAVVVDCHPDYRSSVSGRDFARNLGIPILNVQHHHAHFAACLLDNGWSSQGENALGIVLDGMGFSPSAHPVWGGEILLGDYDRCQRIGGLPPVPMPGGDQLVRQPWRAAVTHLHAALGWSQSSAEYKALSFFKAMTHRQIEPLLSIMAAGLNAPPSSSCGRLFDAVAAILEPQSECVSYEGQAAMRVQSLAEQCTVGSSDFYSAEVRQREQFREINLASMWRGLLDDLSSGRSASAIAYKFHVWLAEALCELVRDAARKFEVQTVAISGGCFQNTLLSRMVREKLQASGLRVLEHKIVPANDGGIALGQLAVAAAMFNKKRSTH